MLFQRSVALGFFSVGLKFLGSCLKVIALRTNYPLRDVYLVAFYVGDGVGGASKHFFIVRTAAS